MKQKSILPYRICFLLLLIIISCSNNSKADVVTEHNSLPAKQEIIWDAGSLRQIGITGIEQPGGYYSYPRMIELSDGRLFCVYEHNGNVELSISADKADTWSKPLIIASSRNNISAATPEIAELKNGDLVVAYNLRPQGKPDLARKFSICIKKSTDKGDTWQQEQVLYEAGYEFGNGCWEPAMVQLPNGEIQLFFSNEGIYTNSSEQNISILRSTDNGITWTTSPQIVSFSSGYRDGMPVPYYDSVNNEVLFSIEDNSKGGEFKPSVLKMKQPWNQQAVGPDDANRINILKSVLKSADYCGAPYLRKSNDGTYIVSFQSTINRSANWKLSTMDVAVGKNLDEMKLTGRPFSVAQNQFALWNSLCVLKDNTIIAITSTNAFNNYGAIWMIKGELK